MKCQVMDYSAVFVTPVPAQHTQKNYLSQGKHHRVSIKMRNSGTGFDCSAKKATATTLGTITTKIKTFMNLRLLRQTPK